MKRIIGILLIITLLFPFVPCQDTEAASKYVANNSDDTVKVGKTTFKAVYQQIGSAGAYKIVMTKNGKKKTILSKVDYGFATNGTLLYYSKVKTLNEYEPVTHTIYCLNLKTGKSKKIVSGKECFVMHCNGKYLYYRTGYYMDADVKLNVINLKTKKRESVSDGGGMFEFCGKRFITCTFVTDVSNVPIYSCNLDGSGKKKIADGIFLKIKNNKVYYARITYSTNTDEYKVYSCSNTGKNRKALTGWLNSIPSKYY